MHSIEPYFNWRGLYISEEDPQSPFYGTAHSEFEFSDRIYDHVIHPQWDNMGSSTLFIKIIYANYDKQFAVIELMGEWNDCLYNDIMFFKRNIIDHLTDMGITKFALIGENVLNFHASDDCYYEEWFEDIEDGWICAINFRMHVLTEFAGVGIDMYLMYGGEIDDLAWRTFHPLQLYTKLNTLMGFNLLSQ